MENLSKFYVNGEWVAPCSSDTMPVLNPVNVKQLGEVALGNEADVDRAVAAAVAAFDHFSSWTKSERLDLKNDQRRRRQRQRLGQHPPRYPVLLHQVAQR